VCLKDFGIWGGRYSVAILLTNLQKHILFAMLGAFGPGLIKDLETTIIKELVFLLIGLVAVPVPSDFAGLHCLSSPLLPCNDSIVFHLGITQTHTLVACVGFRSLVRYDGSVGIQCVARSKPELFDQLVPGFAFVPEILLKEAPNRVLSKTRSSATS